MCGIGASDTCRSRGSRCLGTSRDRSCHLRRQVRLDLVWYRCSILLSSNLHLSMFLFPFLLACRLANCLSKSFPGQSSFPHRHGNSCTMCLNNFHTSYRSAFLGLTSSYLAILLHICCHQPKARLLSRVFFRPAILHYKPTRSSA